MPSTHPQPSRVTTMQKPEYVKIQGKEAAKKFLEHRKTEVRDATLRGESTPVKRFGNWIDNKDKQLHQLNGLDLQEFYNHLKQDDSDYSKTTIRNYMNAIKQFLFYLERVDATPAGIAEKVHIPTLERHDRRRQDEIRPERMQKIINWLDKYKYASRDHVLLLLFWHTGIRRGTMYSLDLDHYKEKNQLGKALTLKHQPETGTPLKNGFDAERPVNLSEEVAEVVEDYIKHNRIENKDEHGRKPLITSCYGRYSADQFRKTCLYYTCPQVTGIGSCSCEEKPVKEYAYNCDKSVSPHCIRSASITYWRQQDVPVEVVSDRMDVTREIIEEHYDRRTEEGKAAQRRKYLDSI